MANDKTFKVKNGLLAQRYLHNTGTKAATSTGYRLDLAVYDNISLYVNAQNPSPSDVFFKSDGLRMYMLGQSSPVEVNQYNLTTAWDISTANYNTRYAISQESSPTGLFIKPDDGTKMYVVGATNKTVYQYTLGIPWSVAGSVSYDSKSFSVNSQETDPKCLFFKPDGTKMYVGGTVSDNINEYNLSTAWDVSTASYSQAFSVSAQEANTTGLSFNDDGTKMYIVGSAGDEVNEFSLSTGWDVSTASYVRNFSVATESTVPEGIFFGNSGTKMYMVEGANDRIHQYTTTLYTETLDLSTGTYFSVTLSGVTEVVFTNPPASNLAAAFVVEINGDGSAITWPTSVKWHEATAPVATPTKEIYTFITTDGGITYYGRKAGEDMQ